ncbi:uncharacterized protein LY79DRAFT_542100 [Colletotrichum navitas]|uniref:Uncharacterized protein n=1 Tax=Colletotrichum navitas TaxID=681940 RepID=A0AAD8V9R6_9PEZI|nr:uncharacterized protein LY79DRAFT_542100 [Colletotrichum navitas]KAK1597081.1 hypothetical protein LY79DRAFT_542100 [Colletotrichum navitas]
MLFSPCFAAEYTHLQISDAILLTTYRYSLRPLPPSVGDPGSVQKQILSALECGGCQSRKYQTVRETERLDLNSHQAPCPTEPNGLALFAKGHTDTTQGCISCEAPATSHQAMDVWLGRWHSLLPRQTRPIEMDWTVRAAGTRRYHGPWSVCVYMCVCV